MKRLLQRLILAVLFISVGAFNAWSGGGARIYGSIADMTAAPILGAAGCIGSGNPVPGCTGAGTGSPTALEDLDISLVGSPTEGFLVYIYDIDSVDADDSPTGIRPDDYVDGGYWDLVPKFTAISIETDSITITSSTDPKWTYNVTDADDTDWTTGTNADAGASSDDFFEFRQHVTEGNKLSWTFDPVTGDQRWYGVAGGTGGDNAYYTLWDITNPTANRTITIPDADVTLANIAVNTAHKTSNGSDHSYIDQDVTSGSAPSFTSPNLTTPILGTITSGVGTSLTALNGENIQDDTIDNDSIDWADMTDLTTDGALDADVVDEEHIADNGIDSEHYNDGSIDLAHMSSQSVDSDNIVNTTIAVGDMAANSIDSDQYVDGSIDIAHMSTDSVDYDNTTGSIKSLTPVADTAANFAGNFTGANLYGGTFVCNVTGSAQLPAPVAGMNFTIITFGAIAVTLLPTAGDDFILDGVQLDDNHDALNASTAGDIAVVQYYDADGWLVTTNGWTEVAD